jgi:ABC-type phosphate transport system substrate-binding protein
MPSATAATEEPIAVIVAPDHAKSLKKDDLALLFKRKKLFWVDGTKAQPANLPATHPLRRAFSQAVLGHTPEELEKYWNDLYFHGISPPHVLASEEAVLRFIAETPGAIGYVPFCSADSRVAVVLVITANGHIVDEVPVIDCAR